jgi:hypothetical protein
MDTVIGWVINGALRELAPTARAAILKTGIGADPALATLVGEVSTLRGQHGRYDGDGTPPSERLVTEDELDDLEAALVTRIRSAAQADSLRTTPQLARVLYMWRELAAEHEPKDWVSKLIQTTEGVMTLLRPFDRSSFVTTIGPEAGVSQKRWLDPKALEPFVDVTALRSRVVEFLAHPDVSENDKEILGRFVDGYEARQQGRDPAHGDD